jgi:hypothetical protein
MNVLRARTSFTKNVDVYLETEIFLIFLSLNVHFFTHAPIIRPVRYDRDDIILFECLGNIARAYNNHLALITHRPIISYGFEELVTLALFTFFVSCLEPMALGIIFSRTD